MKDSFDDHTIWLQGDPLAIKPYVREWLTKEFPGHRFSERRVQLNEGGTYNFDAVSEDETIVGNILSNRAYTRTGRENTGGVRKALNDINYLSKLAPEVRPVLIFTFEEFRDLIRKRSSRQGTERIQMLTCSLPKELRGKLKKVLDDASQEQRAAGESRRS